TAAALNIDVFVPHEIRGGEIDLVIGGGGQHHAGLRFAAFRGDARDVGAVVGGVDGGGSRLAQKFGSHGLVLRFGDQAAADSGLVGHHENREPRLFQSLQA